MFTLSFTIKIFNIFSAFIRISKIFASNEGGSNKFILKLDGHYYCSKKKCIMAVIRMRNKRIIDKLPIKDIINDKGYLKELHPLDACIVGILANVERNGIINKDITGWKKMIRSKSCDCLIKSNPILKISGKYINHEGIEIINLYSNQLNKEIKIPTVELAMNQALLYSLDSLEAVTVGYSLSEQYVANMHRIEFNA